MDKAAQKRRSDRLMLTIPLRISGVDSRSRNFSENARTVVLNRHGARIQTSVPLATGQTLRLLNLVSQREAKFHVVGPVTPLTEKGGEWGVEALDPSENIWGIHFPPPSKQEGEAKALLACRKCRTVILSRVSTVELDVLETSGLLSKPCESCNEVTPWGYGEKEITMGPPPGETSQLGAIAKGSERRRNRRAALQLVVMVRNYHGTMEIAKSEDVSKGGFSFVSEKDYHVGEGLMVACPYSSSQQSIEVPAKIVRRTGTKGSFRKIYGVRYESRD